MTRIRPRPKTDRGRDSEDTAPYQKPSCPTPVPPSPGARRPNHRVPTWTPMRGRRGLVRHPPIVSYQPTEPVQLTHPTISEPNRSDLDHVKAPTDAGHEQGLTNCRTDHSAPSSTLIMVTGGDGNAGGGREPWTLGGALTFDVAADATGTHPKLVQHANGSYWLHLDGREYQCASPGQMTVGEDVTEGGLVVGHIHLCRGTRCFIHNTSWEVLRVHAAIGQAAHQQADSGRDWYFPLHHQSVGCRTQGRR